jgi:hypothetical protein
MPVKIKILLRPFAQMKLSRRSPKNWRKIAYFRRKIGRKKMPILGEKLPILGEIFRHASQN